MLPFVIPIRQRLDRAGIDLSALKGSGPHGRIVKRDVDAAPSFVTPAARAPQDEAKKMAPAAVDPRLYPADSYTAVKLDGMRKVIARRLTQSFNNEVPHFPLNIDIELTKLMEARAALNAASPKDGEGAYKLSVNDFVIKASAMALKKVPNANATFTDEAILLHKHADIGVAVAIDGGLITPIVWKAETKGLKAISAEIKDMAARARAKKLKPEEYQGGTFSVSNLGMFGITSFASIVNQPQGAIMSVGAGEERAVVRGGAVVVRSMMTVTLTCDHRVVDGAVGAQLRRLRRLHHLSETELGSRIGVTGAQIERFERGLNRVGAAHLFLLSRAFGIGVSAFFEGRGDENCAAPDAGGNPDPNEAAQQSEQLTLEEQRSRILALLGEVSR